MAVTRSWILLAAFIGACTEHASTDRIPAVDTAVVGASATAPAAPPPIAAVNRDTSFFARVVGVLSNARDFPNCLTIANDTLAAGTRLLTVSTRLPQTLDSAVVVARRNRPCSELGDERGHAMIDNASYYHIQLADTMAEDAPTVVLATRNAVLFVQDSIVLGDLDGDSDPERFEECTSNEGVHYFVFTGGVQRWHAYYYVPYDLERNCRDGLFTGDGGS